MPQAERDLPAEPKEHAKEHARRVSHLIEKDLRMWGEQQRRRVRSR